MYATSTQCEGDDNVAADAADDALPAFVQLKNDCIAIPLRAKFNTDLAVQLKQHDVRASLMVTVTQRTAAGAAADMKQRFFLRDVIIVQPLALTIRSIPSQGSLNEALVVVEVGNRFPQAIKLAREELRQLAVMGSMSMSTQEPTTTSPSIQLPPSPMSVSAATSGEVTPRSRSGTMSTTGTQPAAPVTPRASRVLQSVVAMGMGPLPAGLQSPMRKVLNSPFAGAKKLKSLVQQSDALSASLFGLGGGGGSSSSSGDMMAGGGGNSGGTSGTVVDRRTSGDDVVADAEHLQFIPRRFKSWQSDIDSSSASDSFIPIEPSPVFFDPPSFVVGLSESQSASTQATSAKKASSTIGSATASRAILVRPLRSTGANSRTTLRPGEVYSSIYQLSRLVTSKEKKKKTCLLFYQSEFDPAAFGKTAWKASIQVKTQIAGQVYETVYQWSLDATCTALLGVQSSGFVVSASTSALTSFKAYEPFTVDLMVVNGTGSAQNLTASLPSTDSLLVASLDSYVRLGSLPPNSRTLLKLNFEASKPGLLSLPSLKLVDSLSSETLITTPAPLLDVYVT